MQAQPTVAVPPLARARALGALIERGDHAVAFAANRGEGLLLGFALEGLQQGERVVVATGAASPRSVQARLRAQGVGAPAQRPDALRVVPCQGGSRCALRDLRSQLRRARRDGYDGLRLAHMCAPSPVPAMQASEATLPRRLASDATVVCIYDRRVLRGVQDEEAWSLARAHGRIVCV